MTIKGGVDRLDAEGAEPGAPAQLGTGLYLTMNCDKHRRLFAPFVASYHHIDIKKDDQHNKL